MGNNGNDPNPQGSRWWADKIYGNSEHIYPEEDYQVAAMPKILLHRELAVRLGIADEDEMQWKGKKIRFSAVSDKQLLHHIGAKLQEVSDGTP